MKIKLLHILLTILIIIPLFTFVSADEGMLSMTGSVKSDTGTKLNLRIDYTITQKPDDTEITVSTKTYLEYIRLKINDERIGTLTVNGDQVQFVTERIWVEEDAYHEQLVLGHDFKITHKFGEPLDITFGSTWTLGGSYSGVHVGEITIDEKVLVDYKQSEKPDVVPPVTTVPKDTISEVKIPTTIHRSAIKLLESGVNVTDGEIFHMTGTITSHTGTYLTLRVEWDAKQEPGDNIVTIKADVYLDYIKMYLPARNGSINIGGSVKEFTTPEMNVSEEVNHSDLIATHTVKVKREWGQGVKVKIDAKWYLGATYTNTKLDWIEAEGTVILSEKYDDMPDTASVTVTDILQNPELPNGCEITSLTIVLNKLGYDIDKLKLNDNYLKIGPVGLTNYYKANLGNPRETNSFGSYSPVIYDTASKYLGEQGNKHTAYDITGHNIDEIYYQLSQGHPIIVWTTQDINTKPLVIRTWVIDGETMHWKHPLHCVVLTGYDMKNKTVTISDPEVGTVTHPMDLFELRWYEMGSQAIYIK